LVANQLNNSYLCKIKIKLNKRTFSMGKSSKKNNISDGYGEVFSLSPLLSRKIEVSFTAPDLFSQGGLLLMREDEQQNGFISRLADYIQLICFMNNSGKD